MSQPNKEVVIATWKAFATRDAAQIEACFTEDAVWIVPERNATALAFGRGEVRRMNRQQIASFIANDWRRLFVSDVERDPMGIYSEGDTVVMLQRLRAKLANGRAYDNVYCFVFKVRVGRIGEMREFMDTLSGFRQVFGEESVSAVAPVVSNHESARVSA